MTAWGEQDRLALLASIDEITAGGGLLGETVARLLEFVVPGFADVATLDTISPSGELRRIGSRVEGPGRDDLERALARRRPVPDAPIGLPRALASAQSQLIEQVTDDDLRAIAADDEDFDLLRALQLRSAVFVPLRARGRTVGALACGVGSSGRRYGEVDLRFAEVLSTRLALALDNAGLSAAVSGLEQRLEATLKNLAEAVLVRDAAGADRVRQRSGGAPAPPELGRRGGRRGAGAVDGAVRRVRRARRAGDAGRSAVAARRAGGAGPARCWSAT